MTPDNLLLRIRVNAGLLSDPKITQEPGLFEMLIRYSIDCLTGLVVPYESE